MKYSGSRGRRLQRGAEPADEFGARTHRRAGVRDEAEEGDLEAVLRAAPRANREVLAQMLDLRLRQLAVHVRPQLPHDVLAIDHGHPPAAPDTMPASRANASSPSWSRRR